MRKNSGKNELAAMGEAHPGAKSSWRNLTNLDRRHSNSLALSAQRHQHLTVRGGVRGGAIDVSIAWVPRESAKNLNFFASGRDISV
jgi:hypothetical protein